MRRLFSRHLLLCGNDWIRLNMIHAFFYFISRFSSLCRRFITVEMLCTAMTQLRIPCQVFHKSWFLQDYFCPPMPHCLQSPPPCLSYKRLCSDFPVSLISSSFHVVSIALKLPLTFFNNKFIFTLPKYLNSSHLHF